MESHRVPGPEFAAGLLGKQCESRHVCKADECFSVLFFDNVEVLSELLPCFDLSV